MSKVEQIIKRVYPPSYTNNSIRELQEYLNKGFIVKHITVIRDRGCEYTDYILEKNCNN